MIRYVLLIIFSLIFSQNSYAEFTFVQTKNDNKLANPTSEEKGTIVAAKKETKKMLK